MSNWFSNYFFSISPRNAQLKKEPRGGVYRSNDEIINMYLCPTNFFFSLLKLHTRWVTLRMSIFYRKKKKVHPVEHNFLFARYSILHVVNRRSCPTNYLFFFTLSPFYFWEKPGTLVFDLFLGNLRDISSSIYNNEKTNYLIISSFHELRSSEYFFLTEQLITHMQKKKKLV